ncbi:hypothetical protein CTEN210_02890 [Chaetoceros tenuissimus]|uniref:Peptidase M11 gametolysin domain-containing protein n=1 Tax=Chaetoceros tenuissimus TaxID=426638 RepID=A0AAD3CK95_9STRA|nr:hypothetical protein CTEN210_02890 [Chaetoceros tenuissimus]
MYSKQILSTLFVASSAFTGSASSLRGNRRRLADNSECTILVAEFLQIPGEMPAPKSSIDCGMDDGQIHRIQGTAYQKEVLKQKLKHEEIISGSTRLALGVGAFTDENGLFIPPGLDIAANLRKGRPEHDRRRLKAPLTGDKPILVVKVIDSGGLARTESAAEIGDDVFGTINDPVNLKSQLWDCSHNQTNVMPGENPDPVNNPEQEAPGVIEVTIPISLTNNGNNAIHNAVTAAVNARLNTNLVNGWDQITEPYHHLMYVIEKCYVDCGWAAYAYINGWMSVYQSGYYKQTGVQVHELGHNFGLYHSGGLDGATYTDHTGMMGNPLYSDDVGKMCYNAAKNWAITWYDGAKDEIDPVAEPSATTVDLVGIAEYDIRAGRPVVVKLETGLSDKFYIGFNRAIGANAQNDEADNEVTIVKANSAGTSQSYLQAHLVQGESHAIINFGNNNIGKDVVITAEQIDISTTPGTATVSFSYQQTDCTSLAKDQCETHSSYCVWSGKGRNKSCSVRSTDPDEPGGPGPSDCVASGEMCPTDGTSFCCNGCQTKGRWAGTCK